MENHVIETSIDELMRALKIKEKMSITEAAEFLKITQKQLEPILNVLEENGNIEIKYPVIGEPKIILKPNAPEKIDIKKTAFVKEERSEFKIEKTNVKERMEAKPEIVQSNETKFMNEKVERLENNILELSKKIDISTLKEDLSEILLITAGLKDIEKITFYLKEVLGLIQKMKEKKIWTSEDKDFTVTMLKSVADNWREYREDDIAKLFDDVKEKVEAT